MYLWRVILWRVWYSTDSACTVCMPTGGGDWWYGQVHGCVSNLLRSSHPSPPHTDWNHAHQRRRHLDWSTTLPRWRITISLLLPTFYQVLCTVSLYIAIVSFVHEFHIVVLFYKYSLMYWSHYNTFVILQYDHNTLKKSPPSRMPWRECEWWKRDDIHNVK